MSRFLRIIALAAFLCVALAPAARADSVFWTVVATAVNTCTGGAGGSGSAPASFSVGPVTCTGVPGAIIPPYSSSAFATGSWVTGDLSAGASDTYGFGTPTVDVNPTSEAISTLAAVGVFTAPPGMTSGLVTFGVTGVTVSATASGGATGASVVFNLVVDDLTTNTISISHGCVSSTPSTNCPGFPGILPPATLTVNSGDQIELGAGTTAQADASFGGTATASIVVDPLMLTLPLGATFNSGIPGFLTGTPTSTAPEPSALLLLGTGMLGMCFFRRQFA